MSLINQRILKKLLHATEIPAAHLAILSAWRDSIFDKTIYKQNETSLDAHFIQKFLIEILEYQDFGKNRTLWKNKAINRGNVDVALGDFKEEQEKIFAVFELKGAKNRDLDNALGREKSPVQQAWEYANEAAGTQWVLVSNYLEIRLYAVGYGRKHYERWDLSKLTEPLEYARLQLLLNAKQLLTGASVEILKRSEQAEKEITQQLYADYKALRTHLLKNLTVDNPQIAFVDLIRFSQKILDRVLFIAFAEDRGLLPHRILARVCEVQNPFNPQPLWNNFKGLFCAINEGNISLNIAAYNGGLFKLDVALDSLVVRDEVCLSFKKLGDYDFDSEVSVTVLGHIFEQSISDLEELQAEARGEIWKGVSKRNRDGIFYTPPYITRYIVEQAVGQWLVDRKVEIGFSDLPVLSEEDYASIKRILRGKRKGTLEYNANVALHIQAWERYKAVLSTIKVLDPACGSGAFLNEVFDYLYQEGQIINERLTVLNGGQAHLFRWDTHILANNLYGVDINYESVEITKLSLWLKTANKQEKLTYLEDNIKCGDSLIEDVNIAGENAFVWSQQFSSIMQAGGFDVIVGNPPYVPLENMSKSVKDFIKESYPILSRKFDLSVVFILKGMQLLNRRGYLSYISSVTWQTGENYKGLRQFLIEQYGLLKLVNLPFNTFSDAYVDTGIYSFTKQRLTEYQVFCFDKKEKSPCLENLNYQNLSISEIKAPDYKIILDKKSYSILTKIKSNPAIVKLGEISKSTQGLAKSAYPISSFNTAEYSFPFFENGVINRYQFVVNEVSYTHFAEKTSLPVYYEAVEKILIKRIINRQNRLVVSFTQQKIVFTKDINPFIITHSEFLTKYVLCLLASQLFSYLYLTNSSIAIKDDFRQTTLGELRELPIFIASLEQQQIFVKQADLLIEKHFCFYQHTRHFLNFMQADLKLEKIGKKLETWYKLEFSAFLKELEKAKVKLTLAQKAEWMTYFNAQKQGAVALQMEIMQIDKTIDQMVYKLYDLTPSEIELIEEFER